MTGHDNLLARADRFVRQAWVDGENYDVIADLAAAVRSERAAREKAEALYMHATARADETLARLRDARCPRCGEWVRDFPSVRALLVVPAADTATQQQTLSEDEMAKLMDSLVTERTTGGGECTCNVENGYPCDVHGTAVPAADTATQPSRPMLRHEWCWHSADMTCPDCRTAADTATEDQTDG